MNAYNSLWDNDIEKRRARLALLPAIVFVVLAWMAFVVDSAGVFARDFSCWGILPGVVDGLVGIIFSPFIHTSLSHLLSNTLPLLILIWFLFYFYSKIAFVAFICLWFSGGFLTWVIGRASYHVGASGLVFGLLFFLFFSGIFRKYIPLVAVSLIVAFIYGSTIWSIFPITEMVDTSISWEGHLSGAVSGLIFAIVFRKQGPQKPEVVWEEEEDD
ncbi:rhomboid family intramembrane serine protease [Proteiniphilum sp. X52]|uniref:rhomboid family intramembrane serine protease n=1 Tax=Proteiniphilum sp. X52 TaxID=2382159 RepID=UPI000F0A0F1D|nr:rhomboid family intramembrane serine protease [Proteiniphilum sp. X52]RNC65061.1 rhomboid family intramembrane serine protease [Proteiniphilum sp. X52]